MKKRPANSPVYFLSAHHRQLLLIVILAFSFVTRIVRLQVPERYIFDEVYHAVTSHLIAANDPQAFEWWNPPPEPNTAVDWLHPPLAKYTQAFFIDLFGYTSFAWRLSSVIFGVGVIWLTYKLAREVFNHEEVGLLAAGLASLDGLLLVQSRIAMNDIHVTFFILLTFWIYWRHRQLGRTLAWPKQTVTRLLKLGTAAGLAMSSKWSGFFALLFVWLYESWDLIWATLNELRQQSSGFWGRLVKTKLVLLLCLGVVPCLVYLGSYWQMFAQGKSLLCQKELAIQGECYYEQIPLKKGGEPIWSGYVSHFAMLHRQIWWYQTNLTATHSYQSRPWQWFFNLRPVWFHVDYDFTNPSPNKDPKQQPVANIYALGNTALFWLGGMSVLFTLVVLGQFALTQGSKKSTPAVLNLDQARQLLFVVVGYGIVWLPWVASPRIMFFYHYAPAVPLLATILAFWVYQLLGHPSQLAKQLGQLAILSCVLFFIFWYPQWTALPVPTWWADTVYYAIKSWK